jgi:threonine/homoserine/homoserine lactone efflux protein
LNILGAVALTLLGANMMGLPLRFWAARPAKDKPAPSGAKAALIIGLTNPLSMVFFVSVAPSFLSAEAVTPTGALAFAAAAVLSGLAGYAPYLGLTGVMTPRLSALVERGCGLLMLVMGVMRLLEAWS